MNVFYLQLEPKLGKTFFFLSRVFSNYKVMLVPIKLGDLLTLKMSQRDYLVCIENSLQAKENFHQARKRFLDFSMNSGRLAVFNISSFVPGDINQKAMRQNSYHHLYLPIEMDEIVREISTTIYKDMKFGNQKWPGGRRAKIPV